MHLHIISPVNPSQFINSNLASYRLRLNYLYNAAVQLGYKVTGNINVDDNANIYYVGKLTKEIEKKQYFKIIDKINNNKATVLVDYTDDWLDVVQGSYKEMYEKLVSINSTIIVPVNGLREKLVSRSKKVFVIPDGIDEIPNTEPCPRNIKVKNVLWHGHASNLSSLVRVISEDLVDYKFNLHLVSNYSTFEILKKTKFKKMPKCKVIIHYWDLNKIQEVSSKCDFAILPVNKRWASANRLITTFRLGLPVIAETISSYKEYSNFYSNFDKDDISAMFNYPEKWHNPVKLAQQKISKDFNPNRLFELWKRCLKSI